MLILGNLYGQILTGKILTLKDHLQDLNLLIDDITNGGFSASEKEQKRKLAIEKAMGLQRALTQSIAELPNKEALSSCMQVFAKSLHIWLEQLYLARETTKKQPATHLELEQQCTKYIDFIRMHFPEDFNQDTLMPICLWKPIQTQVERAWVILQERYKEEPATGLVAVLHAVYQQQLIKIGRVSYHQAAYWEELVSILAAEENTLQNCSYKNMIAALIQYNFNHDSFISYFVEQCLKEIEESLSVMQYWAEKMDLIEQLPSSTTIGYIPNTPSCKVLLKQVISDKIMLTEQQPTVVSNAIETDAINFILLDLTVAQLALLIRLLIDTNIILSKNHTQTLRLVAQFFEARNQKKGSPDALRVKYYNPDTVSIKILRERIMLMLQKINTYD